MISTFIESKPAAWFSLSSRACSMQSYESQSDSTIIAHLPSFRFPSPRAPAMPLPSSPTQNLTAAFLFLRTASTAVTNLTAQTESTKAYIQNNSQNGHHKEHLAHGAQLDTELRDLRTWEARLVQAGMGLVNWAAKVRTGRWLPGEILGLVGERLRTDDLVLPEIW